MLKTAMPARSVAAEAAFRERLTALGAVLLEAEWLGSNKRHHVRCADEHDAWPYPTNVLRGGGACRRCAGKDPVLAEQTFRVRLAELGAVALYDEWRGVNEPHRVRCAAGHDCQPRPSHVSRGEGICKRCGNRQLGRPASVSAEARFRVALAEMGAVPLYQEWAGTAAPHHARCSSGHDCWPRPSAVQQGGGICRTCAGQDPAVAEATFRRRLAELGATPLFTEYAGNKRPHLARCPAGHLCQPRPCDIRKGLGPCTICSGRDPATAEAKFRARLAASGATALFEAWAGAKHPHHVRCAAGHDVWPLPDSLAAGHGPCRICAGNDTATAELAFRARVGELGGIPLYDTWCGVTKPHHVRCAAGHDCYPRPGNLTSGFGLCRRCAGKHWDVFYVVTSQAAVKFGVTSGNPRPRLTTHAQAGYATVARLATGLPGTLAPDTEKAVAAALAVADWRPIRGKEYFDISCLDLVLSTADRFLPRLESP